MHIAYPLRLDGRGRTAEAETHAYIRQLIEQVLFTAPGERVNRPDFGAGLRKLVFGPSTPELAAATEFMVRGALQQWLGDLIVVEGVEVQSEDSTLRVLVRYVVRRTQERATAAFEREV